MQTHPPWAQFAHISATVSSDNSMIEGHQPHEDNTAGLTSADVGHNAAT